MKGIKIDELLARGEKIRSIENNTMNEAPENTGEAVIRPEAEFDEAAYIKDIEKDFALEAKELLVTMQLPHLLVAPKIR